VHVSLSGICAVYSASFKLLAKHLIFTFLPVGPGRDVESPGQRSKTSCSGLVTGKTFRPVSISDVPTTHVSTKRGRILFLCNLCHILTDLNMRTFYFAIDRHAKYCDQRVCLSVGLFVCLCLCSLVYLKNNTSKCHQFFVRISCGRGSVLLWRQYNTLRTSGHVDDVIFSHNAANGPESKTARMFRRVRKVAAPGQSRLS